MSIQLYLPETRYIVASLPLDQYQAAIASLSSLQEFVSLTRDKEEVTLILADAEWEQIAGQFPVAHVEHNRRMIRFDTVLDFSVVGFIAEISKALAEAEISILSISTYRTDAVLVPESRFSDAVHAVKRALVTLSYTHFTQQ